MSGCDGPATLRPETPRLGSRGKGWVAQIQQRFTDAEAHHRKALGTFLEFGDQHSAAITASQLKIALAELGRDEEASLLLATIGMQVTEESTDDNAPGEPAPGDNK
jgi:hypothetical protein